MLDFENKKLKELKDFESKLKNQSLNQVLIDINDNMDNLSQIYAKENKGVLPFSYSSLEPV